MKENTPVVKRYSDKWGGKNYGSYPVRTPGQSLKQSLDSSAQWILVGEESHIDKRNDNQCDIHRGSDFSYRHVETEDTIDIYMKRSRSGKTVDWEFHCSFDGPIQS